VALAPPWVCRVLYSNFGCYNTKLPGMTGAKSALEVKDDMTFLDLTVRQIEHLNTTHRVDVPLILMTSFNTHEDTLRIIKKYANQQLRITTFNQSRYPRILKETLLPAPQTPDDDKKNWYPPGHGDLYNALLHSGVLDQLIAEGKEYLFVSNSDNLGAVYVFHQLIGWVPRTEIVNLQRRSTNSSAYDRH
jgi:UTP--glucose-1-phosphate uridylyltransferase